MREFDGKQARELVSMSVRTLKATSIIDWSVKPGQIIYDKPKEFTYKTDKTLASADVLLTSLGDTPKRCRLKQ